MAFVPDFESDLAPDDASLALVAQLANRQLELEAEVAEIEEQLKKKMVELAKISDEDLPTALSQAGLTEVKLDNGAKIVVKEELTCSVSAEKKPWVIDWLRKHKHDDVIKREAKVNLPKGTDPKLVDRLQKGIERLGLDYQIKDDVNTGTLKAILREQLEKGKKIDLGQFGAFQIKKAKITLPKGKD